MEDQYLRPIKIAPEHKRERKSKAPIFIAAIIIIGAIFGGLLYLNNPEKPLEVITENIPQTPVSSGISQQTPSVSVENIDRNAILDEELSSFKEFNVELEAGRYLFSFAPDADVLIYQIGREGYAKVKSSTKGDYTFDINQGENTNVIVKVQPKTLTKIMLVQRARFK